MMPYPSNPIAEILRAIMSTAQGQAQQRQQQSELDYQNQFRNLQLQEFQRRRALENLQQFEQTYPQQQILGNPALQSTWQQLRTQAGVPLATGPQGPGTMQQVGMPTGTGPGLTNVGTQQPIGPQAQLPILPQIGQQTIAVINRATGQVQYLQVPAGAKVEAYTPPTGPSQSVLVDPTTGKVIQRFPPGVTVHVAPKGNVPDPNQLTDTERRLLTIYLDPIQRAAIGGDQTQTALWLRIRDALRRVGVAVPDQAPANENVPWYLQLRNWFQGISSGAQPSTAGQGLGAPQRGVPPPVVSPPSVGVPPVSPGVPAPPARAIGAPPTAQARTGAPSPRAQAIVTIWTQTKTPVPKARWDSLTAVERAWLTAQGVTSGK